VRRNIKLAESPSFGQTIIKYGPTSNGAQDYRALAREVMAMWEPQVEAGAPQPADEQPAASSAEPVPAAAEPTIEVVLNTAIDQSKLTASRVRDEARHDDPSPDKHDAEVAA
jgi:hypothetical protein